MDSFFTSHTVDPRTGRAGIWRPTTAPITTAAARRRTSGKKVTYGGTAGSPSPPKSGGRRRSKKRSPRSPRTSILRRLYRKLGKYSPRKFRNPYIRDFGEAMLVLGPIIGLSLALAYYGPPGMIKKEED